ncbi:MAG: DUF5668 domain-containing protein [candidate division Zixibacteria bacterium]|nr:DUF5668 domain-containing protein [candidate division Zixibacteria bacterium]
MEKPTSCKDRYSGKYFVGFILIGIGILFLLLNWGIIPSLHKTWPVILIIVGIAFLLGLGNKEKPDKEPPPSQTEV